MCIVRIHGGRALPGKLILGNLHSLKINRTQLFSFQFRHHVAISVFLVLLEYLWSSVHRLVKFGLIFEVRNCEVLQLILQGPARPVERVEAEALTLESADVSANLIEHASVHAVFDEVFEVLFS